MQIILREAIEIDVQQQEKGIPHPQVHVLHTMLDQQFRDIRHVVSLLKHPPTCRDQRLCFRHGATGRRDLLVKFAKLAVGAKALRTTANAKQRVHFVKICGVHMSSLSCIVPQIRLVVWQAISFALSLSTEKFRSMGAFECI